MNGFCGSFSLFSSANYLLTGDEYYLQNALLFPLGGLIFDFLDGKVARWRKSSSMLGQELDSLADLVCTPGILTPLVIRYCLRVDIVRRSACGSRLCCRPSDDSRHGCVNLLYLLWTRTSRQVQCHCGAGAKGRIGKDTLFRGTAHPFHTGVGRALLLLGQERLDRGKGGAPRWDCDGMGKVGGARRCSCRELHIRCMGRDDGK